MYPILAEQPWALRINDPSFIAWLIVAAYLATVLLCWRANFSRSSATKPRIIVLWLLLSFPLILLGLNKQLDLHQLIIGSARDLIAGREHSPIVLGVIAVVMGVLAVVVLAVVIKLFLAADRELRSSYAAFFGLMGAQVLRFLPGPISSVMTAHVFTEEEGLLHIHIIELLELASLAVIGFMAYTTIRKNTQATEQSPAT